VFIFTVIAVIIRMDYALGLFRFHGLKLSFITSFWAASYYIFVVYYTTVFPSTFEPNI
jgi:hypothetical protein